MSGAGGGSGGRVLLTGATGLIGSHAIEPLIDAGHEVHAIARRPPELTASAREAAGAADRVTWHALDLLDANATAAVVDELAATDMLHLAWCTEHGRFWEAPENLSWVGASLSLLRAFAQAGGRRAVIAGTCAEYDWSESSESCSERAPGERPATPERPATLYGTAKLATLRVASAYAERVGASLAWGRVFFLYGPGEDERRLVPSVARALLAGREAPTGDGSAIRDFMHAEDVGRAFAALLDSAVEGPVNVASGAGVAVGGVLDLIAEASGRPELLRRGALPARPGEPARLVADVRRLQNEVGFEPRIALDRGIADAVARLREEFQQT